MRVISVIAHESSVQLLGVVSNVIHTARDSRGVSSIFQLKAQEQKVIVVSEFGTISSMPIVGEIWRVTGQHKSDPTYGSQFKAEDSTKLRPDSNTPLRVLADFLVYNHNFVGINSLWAKRLIRAFGCELFTALSESSVDKLLRNSQLKMSKVMASNLLAGWRQLESQSVLDDFFKNKQLPSEIIETTRQLLGDNAVGLIEENPYLLYPIMSVKAPNKTWKDLDVILTKQFDIEKNDRRRAVSYVESLLYSAFSQNGHMALPIHIAQEALDKKCIVVDLDKLVSGSDRYRTLCINEGSKTVQIIGHQVIEKIINSSLRSRLIDASSSVEKVPFDLEITLSKLRKQGIEFNNEQRCAYTNIVINSLSIIYGCTMTGKSLVLRAAIDAFIENGKNVWLISPTNHNVDDTLIRVTAEPIHSFISKSKSRNKRRILDNSLVIVDEAQTVDVLSFYKLLKCVPLNSKISFVGDHSKLPPLGPGNVFQQLISTGSSLITELKQIYGFKSDNCLDNFTLAFSKSGRKFDIKSIPNEDFVKCESVSIYETIENSHESLTNIVSNLWLELCKGFTEPYQIICANSVLAEGISKQIQQLKFYRKKVPCHLVDDMAFYESEPVVFNKKNAFLNIESGVFAFIHAVFDEPLLILGRECPLSISINGKIIEMSKDDLECLSICYAISASKIQGRKFKNTIVLLDNSYLITKAWLYTVSVASSERMVLVGNRDNLKNTLTTSKYSSQRHFGIPLTLAV